MLEGLTPPEDKSLCKVTVQATDLTPEDFAILQEALSDSRWSTSALASALNERGFAIGETALRKHRSKKCACAR